MNDKTFTCIYCLKTKPNSEKTVDHVFPRSWYTNEILASIDQRTVPCCKTCNNEYSKIEDEILTYLGMCIDPQRKELKNIADKAIRSQKKEYGKNQKDRMARVNRGRVQNRTLYLFSLYKQRACFPH